MIEGLLSTWLSLTSSFFAAPLGLFTGNTHPLNVLAAAGIVSFVVGLILAVVKREKRARLLLVPLILAIITPIIIGLGNLMMGWFGLLFVLIAGGVILLLWILVVAMDSNHRLPIWLIGLGLLSFIAYCAFVAIALIWGA